MSDHLTEAERKAIMAEAYYPKADLQATSTDQEKAIRSDPRSDQEIREDLPEPISDASTDQDEVPEVLLAVLEVKGLMRFKITKDPDNPPNRREMVAFWIGLHWVEITGALIGVGLGIWVGMR